MVDIKIENDFQLNLGALASLDAIAEPSVVDSSMEQGFRVAKIRISGGFGGKTTAEGPIAWGLAIGLTGEQIENVLEADPQGPMDETRLPPGAMLKHLGFIKPADTEGFLTPDGNPIEVKLNWSVPEGQSMLYWAYNMGSSALTTGTALQLFGEYYGVWLRD